VYERLTAFEKRYNRIADRKLRNGDDVQQISFELALALGDDLAGSAQSQSAGGELI
jgi:hypothetical protein